MPSTTTLQTETLAPEGGAGSPIRRSMSTDPAQRARSTSPAAERMRRYRKGRRSGMRCVRISLHVTEIDDLIRLGHLQREQRENAEALQTAVLSLVYRALDEAV